MKPTRRIVAGIFLKGTRVLMGRRLEGDGFYGGHWEFPGGKIEENEGEIEALEREIREELDVGLLAADFFENLSWEYPQLNVEVNFYLVKLSEDSVEKMKLHSHSELCWFDLEEAHRERILPANRTVLDHLIKKSTKDK